MQPAPHPIEGITDPRVFQGVGELHASATIQAERWAMQMTVVICARTPRRLRKIHIGLADMIK
jgi:hypothetical protein